jgi:integrase
LKEKALQDPEVKKNQSEAELRKSVTLQQYWDDVYCPYKLSTVSEKEKWKPSTEKDMKSFYNAWIKDTKLASMKVMDIERNTIEVLITKIQETRSKRTSKKAVECLSPLFKKFYYENHIVKLNPADIKLGDLDNKREVEVSISMAKRLYDAMENYPIPQYRDIFLWLRTGRRLGEVLSLEMTDIDIDKRLFHIIPDKNKAGKRTTFVLRDELLPSLENKTSLIHPSKKDTVMDSHTVRHHWTNVLETAKISDIHLHDIRHIIGTILRDSGVNEELRALVLGHTRSGITARYASKNAELANDIFDFFLEKINGELGAKTQWPEYYKDEDE